MSEVTEVSDEWQVLSTKERVILRFFRGDTHELVAEVLLPADQIGMLTSVGSAVEVQMQGNGRCAVSTMEIYP